MKHSSFNPKARWDRNIPETEDSHENQELNENIEVLARFKNNKICPQEFNWHNKEYKIDKVTFYWQERRGQELISLFSVDCSGDLYQISFSHLDASWKIDKIIE